MSRILKDVAYCIGIFLRDLVDYGSCRLFVVRFYGSWISQIVLLWDPLDLGSCIQVMLWDPRDLGSLGSQNVEQFWPARGAAV